MAAIINKKNLFTGLFTESNIGKGTNTHWIFASARLAGACRNPEFPRIQAQGKEQTMNTFIYMTGALLLAAFYAARMRRAKFIVPEGHYGLLYRDQKYLHRISPGRHCFWSRRYSVRLVDMRKLKLAVAGREFASADKVGVKINAQLSYQIIQAETAVQAVQDYIVFLDGAVQAALASVIAAAPIETLLNERLEINRRLHALVLAEADKIGIVIHAVETEDVMVASGLSAVATAQRTQP